ncbi:MAG: hypothetical protein CL583_03875 [Alteromonadaceae bacterium]|nr:hypothetical protein [Alteromonadaceae bacterium]|tara:strand:+ start:149 stop:925 length:777 start_codon:yes stop_codon:yes gene_type:complete
MESRSFIYAPAWVKVVSIAVLVLALISAAAVAFYFLGEENGQDWILIAMSLGQVAASGIVIAMVVFFSERDVNVMDLQRRSERLFYETFPNACLLIDFPLEPFKPWEERRVRSAELEKTLRNSRTAIEISHVPGQIDAYYRIRLESGQALVMRLQVNIGEVAISYYIPAASEAEKDRISGILEWAFSRYREIGGYEGGWYFSREAFDNNCYASIHLTRDFGADFLENERKKLFMSNDVAASTRGILKDCLKNGIATAY